MRTITKWPARAARATSGRLHFPQKRSGTELFPAEDLKHEKRSPFLDLCYQRMGFDFIRGIARCR